MSDDGYISYVDQEGGPLIRIETPCEYLFMGLSVPDSPVVLDVVVRCRLVAGHDGPHFAGISHDGSWFV